MHIMQEKGRGMHSLVVINALQCLIMQGECILMHIVMHRNAYYNALHYVGDNSIGTVTNK